MTTQVGNPLPVWFDRRGRPLAGGRIYIGVAGEDPQTDPIPVFFDADLTIAATQPIGTIGGLPVTDGGNATPLFVSAAEYSVRVRDADGAEVLYMANANLAGQQYQPLDVDLTEIAALTTAAFGREVLTKATANDVLDHLGIEESLPIAGGAMQGNLTRLSSGGYLYMADNAYGRVRVFVTENGATDPRTSIGDIWLEQEA